MPRNQCNSLMKKIAATTNLQLTPPKFVKKSASISLTHKREEIMNKNIAIFAALGLSFSFLNAEPPAGKNRKLVFEDNFDYPRAKLDETWIAENQANGHILSSRWSENVVIDNGVLSLQCRKEKRGGQDWTAGSIWTKKHFLYGYFECRYRYAKAGGVNNSFWIMTRGYVPPQATRFEIDINEGHYPNEINMTVHNWSDVKKLASGEKAHPSVHKEMRIGGDSEKLPAFVSLPLDVSISAKKIRFSSNHFKHFHLREIWFYKKNSLGGYPELDENTDNLNGDALENLALKAKVAASGVFTETRVNAKIKDKAENAIDGKVQSAWVSNPEKNMWIEFDFDEPQDIGCIQFLTGWKNDGEYIDSVSDYKLEYFDGAKWVEIASRSEVLPQGAVNLSEDWHIYGLDWNEKELIFYFDGKELWRTPNNWCHFPAPVFLSAAVTHWAHRVTDATNNTGQDIDYVKIWQDTAADGGGIFEPAQKPKPANKPAQAKPQATQ